MRIVITDDGFEFPDEIPNTTKFLKDFYGGLSDGGVELQADMPECFDPVMQMGLCG